MTKQKMLLEPQFWREKSTYGKKKRMFTATMD